MSIVAKAQLLERYGEPLGERALMTRGRSGCPGLPALDRSFGHAEEDRQLALRESGLIPEFPEY